jgi:GNAT superfamily N-acetyltransferase
MSEAGLATDPDSVRLRALVANDAAAAAGVIAAAFAVQSEKVDPPQSALGETAESLAVRIARDGGAAADAAGALVGIVLWSETGGGLYVARLSVVPAWRGHGIARRLLDAAEAEARRRRLPRLHLGTRLTLLSNRRLFASRGYVEIAEHAHPGYDHPTWVEMEKRLI